MSLRKIRISFNCAMHRINTSAKETVFTNLYVKKRQKFPTNSCTCSWQSNEILMKYKYNLQAYFD